MSKLSQLIDYKFTGDCAMPDRRPTTLKYLSVAKSSHEDSSGMYGIRRQFKLSAKLETTAWLNEDHVIQTTENPVAMLPSVLTDLKRAMIEEVFGEFRPYIIEMRTAIYDRDDTRLRHLLAELEQRMFVE